MGNTICIEEGTQDGTDGPNWPITLQTVYGKGRELVVEPTWPVARLKSVIYAFAEDDPSVSERGTAPIFPKPNLQRLIFDGKELVDHETLGHQGLRRDACVHVLQRREESSKERALQSQRHWNLTLSASILQMLPLSFADTTIGER
jgi:hypothetical protein